MANDQFLVPFVYIANNGTRVTNHSVVDFLFNNAEGTRVATLGRYFLTGAHLTVNHDTDTFTLSQAAPYTGEPDLVPIIGESTNQSCTGPPVPPSPSSISVGTVVGAAVGGGVGLAAIAFAVFMFIRRRRKGKKMAAQPVEYPEIDIVEHAKPNVLAEMSHDVRPQEMEGPALDHERHQPLSPGGRRPVYEMDVHSQSS